MCRFFSLSCCILVCLQSVNCSVLLQSPVTTTTDITTTTATSATIPSTTHRKPISIVDTLIVHLINSQPNPSSSSHHHHKSHHHFATNSIQSNNSTDEDSTPHPALACTDGATYWDPLASQCVKCTSSCPTGAYVSRVCNRTHDLECQCHKGSYMSVVDKTCKPCAECPHGWGVWRTCRWSRNTVCRKCQPGTYSGASVGTLGCIPCTKCGPNQEVIAECDGNRDTVCVDRATLRANFSHYFPRYASSGSDRNGISSSLLIDNEDLLIDQEELAAARERVASSYQESTATISAKSVHQNALPIYFAILVVIVFSLCFYALIQLRCSEINGRTHMMGLGGTHADHKQLMFGSQSAAMVPQVVATGAMPCQIGSPYYQQQPIAPGHHIWSGRSEHQLPIDHHSHTTVMHLYTSQRCKAPGRVELAPGIARNGSSGSNKSRPKYKAYYELLYAPNEEPVNGLRELTPEAIETLERRLANDSISWKMLAKELGYNDKQMAEFETKSTTSDETGTVEPVVDTVQVIRLLLTHWCHRVGGETAPATSASGEQTQTAQNSSSINKWPVAALVKALTRIGRVDCARLVQQHAGHKQHSSPSTSSTTSTTASSCVSS